MLVGAFPEEVHGHGVTMAPFGAFMCVSAGAFQAGHGGTSSQPPLQHIRCTSLTKYWVTLGQYILLQQCLVSGYWEVSAMLATRIPSVQLILCLHHQVGDLYVLFVSNVNIHVL